MHVRCHDDSGDRTGTGLVPGTDARDGAGNGTARPSQHHQHLTQNAGSSAALRAALLMQQAPDGSWLLMGRDEKA